MKEKASSLARLPERTEPEMQRVGTSGEVSSLVSWLASEDGGYMTGQNLRIDGGLTRSV